MFKPICILFFMLFFTITSPVNASYEYAVIATQQKAENIVQQLKPLFADQAHFSAKDYQLIIKASPDIIKEIKYVLKQIDQPLKNFIIRVANKKTLNQLLKSTPASRQLYTQPGSNSAVKTIRKSAGGTVKITSSQRNSDFHTDGVFQARAVEGNWVAIHTTKQIPYYTTTFPAGVYPVKKGKDKYHWAQTSYKKIKSGFDAKVILKADNQINVTIRIQNHYRDKQNQDIINSNYTESIISGALGEWIEIGQIGNLKKQQQTGVQYSSNQSTAETTLYIKVNTI